MSKIKTVQEPPKRATTSIRYSRIILNWKDYMKRLRKKMDARRATGKKFTNDMCIKIYLMHMISHLSWSEMGLYPDEIEHVYNRVFVNKAVINKMFMV